MEKMKRKETDYKRKKAINMNITVNVLDIQSAEPSTSMGNKIKYKILKCLPRHFLRTS